MTYPRERNGWTDEGRRIGPKEPCPNCGSAKYYQTVSREHCPDCGLECDYWGGGANKVYEDMMAANARAERDEEEARYREWLDDESNWRW